MKHILALMMLGWLNPAWALKIPCLRIPADNYSFAVRVSPAGAYTDEVHLIVTDRIARRLNQISSMNNWRARWGFIRKGGPVLIADPQNKFHTFQIDAAFARARADTTRLLVYVHSKSPDYRRLGAESSTHQLVKHALLEMVNAGELIEVSENPNLAENVPSLVHCGPKR